MSFRPIPPIWPGAAPVLLVAFGLLAAPLRAQVNGSVAAAPAGAAPELRELGVRPASGSIAIDAELGDAGWVGAARINAFVEHTPREGARPPVETEVSITYDETNLYVAIVARDPDPRAIRAALQPRDQLWDDDWIGVLLDPFGDASLGYYFLSNPIGVQADMQMTSRNEDSSIDFLFSNAGRITEDGYVVEMAIPFRSLRVPDRDPQTWGIMLVRTYPRSSRHYLTWPSMSRNNPCQICQVARLEGIRGIESGGALEILPAVVASHSGQLRDASDPGSFASGDVEAEASLGLKYAFERFGTVEATLNPDFSQVESDAAQVDVNSTFALFYPERRPFFQEGMNLYQTPLNVFYSRSINAPEAAVKLTGRAGSTSVGYIGARDELTPFIVPFGESSTTLQGGRSFTNVLRVQHNRGASHAGALVTDRRLDGGGSGTTVGADIRQRFGDTYTLEGQFVLSHTREPESPDLGPSGATFGDAARTAEFDGESYVGHATHLWFARDTRTWSWNVLYLGVSPTYRADTGFQTRNDFHRATGWTGVTLYPNLPLLERISTSVFGGSYWNFRGERTQDLVEPYLGLTLPHQTNLDMGASFQAETFGGVRLRGIRNYWMSVNSRLSEVFQGGIDLGQGRRVVRRGVEVPEVGRGRDVGVRATIRPTSRILIEPSLNWEELRRANGEEVFRGTIVRSRFGYQHSRELSFRVVVQYDGFDEQLDIEPLVAYQINPLSIFYIGSTHRSSHFDGQGMVRTDRQFFAKVQYVFRR